jgi:hypothetical protein
MEAGGSEKSKLANSKGSTALDALHVGSKAAKGQYRKELAQAGVVIAARNSKPMIPEVDPCPSLAQ